MHYFRSLAHEARGIRLSCFGRSSFGDCQTWDCEKYPRLTLNFWGAEFLTAPLHVSERDVRLRLASTPSQRFSIFVLSVRCPPAPAPPLFLDVCLLCEDGNVYGRVGGEAGLMIGTSSVPSTSGLTGPALPRFRVFPSSYLFSFSSVLAWFVRLFCGSIGTSIVVETPPLLRRVARSPTAAPTTAAPLASPPRPVSLTIPHSLLKWQA